MHFSLMEHLKKKDDLKKQQLGIVVSNDDPQKIGRVKVRIKNVLEGSIENLPWCYPQMSTNVFGGKFLKVPKLEEKLIIEFEDHQPYFLFYTGYWQDKKNTLSHSDIQGYSPLFKSNYPNVEGWNDEINNYEVHNLVDKFIEHGFFSGYKRRIDKDGKLTDKALKEYIIEVLNKYQVDSSNILLGTGSTGHKQLVTKDHLDLKYNALLQFLLPLYTALGSASIDPATIAFANAVVAGLNNFLDNSNFTNQTKAK